MPTNLNALIRYKQIDAYLKNKFINCTIEKLQDACTVSLGEFRGIYKKVSERTIRDDIRVMKSNILGFNAPIEVSNGIYYYSEKNYSIFTTPVTEIELLRDILKMLLEERNNIVDTEVDNLLLRIATIVGDPIPSQLKSQTYKESTSTTEVSEDIRFSLHYKYPDDDLHFLTDDDTELTSLSLNKEPLKQYVSKQTLLWQEILGII